MVQYAQITKRDAYLTTDFGIEYATRLFGAEVVATMPKISKGPRKGQMAGKLVWVKCTVGGWFRDARGGCVMTPGFVSAHIEINGAIMFHTVHPNFERKCERERDERVRSLRNWIADDRDFIDGLEDGAPIHAKMAARLARYWGELAELSTW